MIRSARIADVPDIHRLITSFAEQGLMLFRTPTELYESVRSFLVCEQDGRVVGCCALDVLWKDMAEVRSLAVDASCHGDGVGSKMVQVAMEEARRLGICKVLALTYRQSFFERIGFKVVPRKALPHKVWTACVTCPKQACCDEIPMLYDAESATGEQAAGEGLETGGPAAT